MRKIVASVALFLVAVLAASAHAEVTKDAEAKIQYEVPAGMKVTTQGNMVALDEPKGEVAFFITKFAKADQQKAMSELDTVLSSFLKDVKPVGDPKQAKHNGMNAVAMKATATYNGKPANVTIMILQPPGDKVVAVAGVVLTEKKDAWQATAMQFINSIKPL